MRWHYLQDYLEQNKVKSATEAAQLIGMSNANSLFE